MKYAPLPTDARQPLPTTPEPVTTLPLVPPRPLSLPFVKVPSLENLGAVAPVENDPASI